MARKRQKMDDFLDQVGLSDRQTADAGVVVLPETDRLLPDPDQPRRQVIPEDLRSEVVQGKMLAKDALGETWARCLEPALLKRLRAGKVSAADALAEQRAAGPRDLAVQIALQKLVELADSIAEHGLVQPVAVYKEPGGTFRIAVGERRWWAHVHLLHVVGNEDGRRIRAIEIPVPEDDVEHVARQYAENVHRSDLSDIARARAIAKMRSIVLGEMTAGDDATKPPSHQVDETTGERLAEITGRGMSGRSVRNYMALLGLPAEAQRIAEVAGLSERSLRDLTTLDDEATQMRLVTRMATEEITAVEARETARRIKKDGGATATAKSKTDGMRSWIRRLQRSVGFAVGKLPDADKLAKAIAALPRSRRDELIERMMLHAKYVTQVVRALEKALPDDEA